MIQCVLAKREVRTSVSRVLYILLLLSTLAMGVVRAEVLPEDTLQLTASERAYQQQIELYFRYYEEQKPDSAELALRKALEILPEAEGNFLLKGNLAELVVSRGDTLGAVTLLGEALGKVPNVTRLRSRRAELLEECGRLSDALLDLDYLVQSQPTWEIPLYNRARVKMKMGLLDGAIADLQSIVQMNDKAYLPRIALAKVLAKKGDLVGAEQVATYLINHYPKTPHAYRTRARIRLQDGRKAEALKDIRYVINDLKAATAEDYRIRGDIWKAYGEEGEAEADYERADLLQP